MSLRDKYAYAIQTAKGHFQGSADERDGKLHFTGTVATEDEKNQIWNAIKTIPDWQKEVVADIRVTGGPAAPAAARSAPAPAGPAGAAAGRTYTVQPGDTLSKIAKEHLGNASAYMKIFEANKDQLTRSRQDQAGPGSADSVVGPRPRPAGRGCERRELRGCSARAQLPPITTRTAGSDAGRVYSTLAISVSLRVETARRPRTPSRARSPSRGDQLFADTPTRSPARFVPDRTASGHRPRTRWKDCSDHTKTSRPRCLSVRCARESSRGTVGPGLHATGGGRTQAHRHRTARGRRRDGERGHRARCLFRPSNRPQHHKRRASSVTSGLHSDPVTIRNRSRRVHAGDQPAPGLTSRKP